MTVSWLGPSAAKHTHTIIYAPQMVWCSFPCLMPNMFSVLMSQEFNFRLCPRNIIPEAGLCLLYLPNFSLAFMFFLESNGFLPPCTHPVRGKHVRSLSDCKGMHIHQ
ncbi:hypothetical protein XENORESO_001715 [Xenotaenia resolanae]|uniref:Uncharacterized protein n=1 Tax=Xenotaenia resolanae TaxID=208358 RepID=A0ABV0W3E2_9TELE